jgi:hypothetical protein
VHKQRPSLLTKRTLLTAPVQRVEEEALELRAELKRLSAGPTAWIVSREIQEMIREATPPSGEHRLPTPLRPDFFFWGASYLGIR